MRKSIFMIMLAFLMVSCASYPNTKTIYVYDDLYTPYINVSYVYSNQFRQWGYYNQGRIWCPAPRAYGQRLTRTVNKGSQSRRTGSTRRATKPRNAAKPNVRSQRTSTKTVRVSPRKKSNTKIKNK